MAGHRKRRKKRPPTAVWPLPGKRASTKPYSSSHVFHSDLGYASGVRSGFASLHLLALVFGWFALRRVALVAWRVPRALVDGVGNVLEGVGAARDQVAHVGHDILALGDSRRVHLCVRVCVEIFADREERDIVLVRDWCEIQRGGGGNKNANSMRGERVVVLVAGAPRTTTS